MQDKFKCPKCGGSQTRTRIKTNNMICYSCGNIWEKNKEEDNGRS